MFNWIAVFLFLVIPPKVETYTIHGKILEDVRSYGGMYREYDENNIYPAHGMKLKVVRFADGKTPVVVDTVRSDVNGRFSVELPVGTYGFIGLYETPVANQFMPADSTSDDRMTGYSSTWTANISFPIVLKDKDVVGVHLTNFRKSTCYLCP